MYVQRVGVGEGKICLQPRLGFLHGLLELAELALRLTVWEAYEGGARGGEVVDEVDVVKAGAYAQFVLQILGKALPLLVIDVHHRDDLFLRKASGVSASSEERRVGQSVSVRVVFGGRRSLKNKNKRHDRTRQPRSETNPK